MDLSRTEIEYNKIKNLRQYKNFSESDLRKVAYNRALQALTDVESMLSNIGEKKMAKGLLKKYLDDFTPETTSDINILRSVIFLEVINHRLQSDLNKKYDNNEEVPLKMIEIMHKNLDEVLTLKKSLGITRDSKKIDQTTVDRKIATIRAQFEVWLENNQASRHRTCPHCGQMILLRMRMDHYDLQKHPMFRDRILCNRHLVKMYQQEKLTKEDVAKVLEVSNDYVEWLVKRWPDLT